MNEELTTEQLMKLCRICFRDGEYNLLEYKVQLPRDEGVQEGAENGEELEIEGHKMLKIFDMCEEASFDIKLDLICQWCLDKLVSCYLFYRKLKASNVQIQKLSKEAKVNEKMSLQTDNEEQVEFLDDYIEEALLEKHPTQENVPATTTKELPAQPRNNSLKEFVDICETRDKVPESFNPSQTEGLHTVNNTPRKVLVCQKSRDPKFILTGGVSQLLTHIKDSENIHIIQAKKRAFRASSVPHKRQRKNCDQKKPLKNASLVVAQFIPTAAQILHTDTNAEDVSTAADSLALDEAPDPPSELLTVDCATVQVDTQNLNKIEPIWNDIEITANADAVYICKYCPQAYSAPTYLVTHLRSAHICKFCTQAFSKTNDLHAHLRSEHQSNKCAICDKELSSRSNLRAHISRVHGIQLPAKMTILDYLPKENEHVSSKEISDFIEEVNEDELISQGTNL